MVTAAKSLPPNTTNEEERTEDTQEQGSCCRAEDHRNPGRNHADSAAWDDPAIDAIQPRQATEKANSMKKLASIIASLALCISALAPVASIVATSAALTACKTSQRTVAYKSIAALQASVSAALDGWADYVVKRRSQITALPEAEQPAAAAALAKREALVRLSLKRYQQAAAVAQIGADAAGLSGAAPAPGPLLEAGNDLIATAAAR